MRREELINQIHQIIWFFDIEYSYGESEISIEKGLVELVGSENSIEHFDGIYVHSDEVLVSNEKKELINIKQEKCFLTGKECAAGLEKKVEEVKRELDTNLKSVVTKLRVDDKLVKTKLEEDILKIEKRISEIKELLELTPYSVTETEKGLVEYVCSNLNKLDETKIEYWAELINQKRAMLSYAKNNYVQLTLELANKEALLWNFAHTAIKCPKCRISIRLQNETCKNKKTFRCPRCLVDIAWSDLFFKEDK